MKTAIALVAGAVAMVGADFAFYGHEYTRTALGDAVDKASMKMLKEAYDSGRNENVISSPLGVLLLLALYSEGADGKIREEIMTLLGFTDYKQLSHSYSQLSEKFGSMDSSFLTLANKVFLSNQATLNDDFAQTAARSYRTEVEKVNFDDSKAAANSINKWADVKTKGHIKEPISEGDIDSSTVAALLNVIFFQGHWHVPFNASNTKEKDFHVDLRTRVKKPTMHLFQSLFYYEDTEIEAKMVELPYKEAGFRMVVVLPDKVDGLQSVVEKLAEKGLLTDVFKLAPAGAEVDLEIPKFDIKSKLNLNTLLPKVGVSSIFEDEATGIIKDRGVVVSKALQEAFVKVDEEGATAGAFTGLVMVLLSSISTAPPPISFKVDHPFLFAIYYEDILLFTGTYSS